MAPWSDMFLKRWTWWQLEGRRSFFLALIRFERLAQLTFSMSTIGCLRLRSSSMNAPAIISDRRRV